MRLDNEHFFTTIYGGQPKQRYETCADYFYSDVLSAILVSKIIPHLFNASGITY